jgi:hypothetical protein
MSASADSNWAVSPPSICSGVTTIHRGSRSKSTADADIFSAVTIFTGALIRYSSPPNIALTKV